MKTAAILLLLIAGAGVAHAQAAPDRLAGLAATLRPAPGGAASAPAIRAVWSSTGALRYLGAPEGQAFQPPARADGRPEVAALSFLRAQRPLLGVTSAAVDFALLQRRARGDRRYLRFQQTHAGLPVFGAQASVQLDARDGVEAVIADLATGMDALDRGGVPTRPALGAVEATERAVTLARAAAPDARVETKPATLAVFVPQVLGSEGESHLVWQVDVGAREGPGISRRYLLDAMTGDPVRVYPLDYAALDRRIYDGNNTGTSIGNLVRSEGQAPCGLADADAAYDDFGETYVFYAVQHARDSFDDAGADLLPVVRSCFTSTLNCPMPNAFWDGFYGQWYFGDGWVVDDVVGHEYTHAVTQYTSNLIYENQSGAMNESFSDIWGEFVDLTNGTGIDDPSVRWLIGEELAQQTLRNMADPPYYGQPDRLGSPLYRPAVANPNNSNDQGWVHTNSGVNNKLCFLLTDGGTFNGQTVSAMGLNRVAALYYEVNANLLTAGADWLDLFVALTQAAINLGWTAGERDNLERACIAVDIAIYVVDGSSGCPFQTGAWGCGGIAGPFHTVQGGIDAIADGATLWIRPGYYAEPLTFTKRGRYTAPEGPATIGP